MDDKLIIFQIVFKDISVKFSIYEDVFINIYLGLLQMNSRFLNDKTVIVLFPQLDDRKFNVDENSFYISNSDNSNNYPNFIRIEDNISIQRDHSYSITESRNRDRIINEYNHVCVGGSFDHFHIGHYVICVNSDSFIYLNYVSQKISDYRINFRSDDWKEEWS